MDTKQKAVLKSKLKVYATLYRKAEQQNDSKRMNLFTPDMDLNAGRIIAGEKTIEEVGEEVFELMLKVLNGQMTKNEALHYYATMDIYCLGPVI